MSSTISQRQHTVNTARENRDESGEFPARTPTGDALSALVVQVFRLNGLFLAAGDALAEPAGQTSAHWRVLAAIEEKPMTVAQIARAWGLARQSVQRVANVLDKQGLAVYEPNPHHRRAQLLVITPEGRTVLRMVQAAQREWANALGEQIGEEDLRQASEILGRVLEKVR